MLIVIQVVAELVAITSGLYMVVRLFWFPFQKTRINANDDLVFSKDLEKLSSKKSYTEDLYSLTEEEILNPQPQNFHTEVWNMILRNEHSGSLTKDHILNPEPQNFHTEVWNMILRNEHLGSLTNDHILNPQPQNFHTEVWNMILYNELVWTNRSCIC